MSAKGSIAANTNEPLWKRVTLRLAANENRLNELSEVEQQALWEKVASTMKPDPQELALLMKDEAEKRQYMLRFVRAYKAGMPPLSSLTETRFPPSSE